MDQPWSQAILKRIRVRSEDSAFIYCLLEAYEGIAAYSTLPHVAGDRHRDLELQIPLLFQDEVSELLDRLGELVLDLGEVAEPGI